MRFILKALAAITVLIAVPASAQDWYRAETQHFIVYAEDSPTATKDFARDLERLDEVLRILTGIGPDDGSLPDSAKVTVFRFGETRDMSTLAGLRGGGIGGFFSGRANGSVAFVPKQQNKRRGRSRQQDLSRDVQLDPKGTLFHEYVHYFMFQHSDAPYPLWYSEGFAELFSNVEFGDDHFLIGEVPSHRSISLSTVPIDLEKMFDPPRNDRYYTARTYAHGWLLASHLNLNPKRRGQMTKYMQAIAEGKPIMEAAEIAFGNLGVLRKELEEFRQGAARVLKVPYATQADPAVDIRPLDEAEEAIMETVIISKVGVDEDRARSQVAKMRDFVSRYPQSPAVLLAATEAEFDARNYGEAEEMAQRVLAINSDSTEAAMYYADAALRQSYEDPSKLAVARSRFAAANRMETDHAYPLYGYYLTYLFDESVDEIPDAAKRALEASFRYAPFDNSVRQALVHMLLMEDRPNEAKIVGASYIDGNGGFDCLRRKKFEQFVAGNKEPLLEQVRPRHPGDYWDEDRRKAESEKIEKEIEEAGCKVD